MKIDQEVGTKCEVAYRRVYNLDKLSQNRKFNTILLKISQLSFLSFIPRPQSVIDSSNLQQKVIDLLFTSQVVGTRSSDQLDIYDFKTRDKHLRLPTRNFQKFKKFDCFSSSSCGKFSTIAGIAFRMFTASSQEKNYLALRSKHSPGQTINRVSLTVVRKGSLL